MVITPASTPAAPVDDDGTAAMAAQVASGPGFWTEWLAELDRRGLLEDLLAGDVIARALREAPSGHKYDRVLTAKMTVICVLVACLFPGAGYDTVLATASGLPGLRSVPGAEIPSGSAFSQARKLLGEQVMQRLFELDAAVADADPGIGLLWKGLEVTAIDGTTMELARNDVLEDGFTPGILNLADRGFFSMHRWIRFSGTGADLAWRVKNGARSVPLKAIRTLPDGSELVMLHESDGMRTRRRKGAGDPRAERLPDTTARSVPGTRPPGSPGTPAQLQHRGHRHRPRRRIRRARPRAHPVHRRPRPRPLPRRRRCPLPALRTPPRQRRCPASQPGRRHPRPAPPPARTPADIRQDRRRTTNQAHRRSHLHHRHHKVESPKMGHNSRNLRAVVSTLAQARRQFQHPATPGISTGPVGMKGSS